MTPASNLAKAWFRTQVYYVPDQFYLGPSLFQTPEDGAEEEGLGEGSGTGDVQQEESGHHHCNRRHLCSGGCKNYG